MGIILFALETLLSGGTVNAKCHIASINERGEAEIHACKLQMNRARSTLILHSTMEVPIIC